MANKTALQLLGFILGVLGFFGTVTATLLPDWRTTAHIGANIITSIAYMRGLWMECVWHSTGIYQCQTHRSLLALPPDLQAARALMVLSCVASALATVLAAMGMKCTQCCHGRAKSSMLLGGAVSFLSGGLLCLVPVSWTTHSIVMDFYNHFLLSAMKYEIGPAIYVGYTSSFLSLTGGLTLCMATDWQQQQQPSIYPPPRQMVRGLSSGLTIPRAALTFAPSHRPPETQGNRGPSGLSVSRDGYRLNGFY